jgi:phosphoribosylglycinamide formyltransferase-1
MDACRAERISGRIVFVGADNPKAYGLTRAKENDIPAFVTDYKAILAELRDDHLEDRIPEDFSVENVLASQRLMPDGEDRRKQMAYFSKRAIAEAALLANMSPYPFDLLVLAGFMRVLTPYFIDSVNTVSDRPRIMNIHPALLPAFPGVDGYGDTFRYGCKVAGCTVHFVDYGEDTGPIIGQRAFDILPEDTLESVRKKGLQLEWDLYCDCIALFAQGRLRIVRRALDPNNERASQRKVVEISR